MESKTTFSKEIEEPLSSADIAIKKAQSYLISQGKIIDLSDWVSIKEYCKRYNIENVETVINWINRGVVPA